MAACVNNHACVVADTTYNKSTDWEEHEKMLKEKIKR